jgi:HK97 family phage major capsid protein
MNKVLERLAAEREQVNDDIDRTLANIEADGRDPSDLENGSLSRMKDRFGELEQLIRAQVDLEKMRLESTDAHSVLHRATPARDNGDSAAPPPPQSETVYRSAGEFIVDHLRARGGMRDYSNSVLAPDANAIERMQMLSRTVANQISSDTAGILPTPIVGDVLQAKMAVQPFISSIGGAKPMGGIPGATFTRPKITQHATSGTQATEKTELTSQKMTISSVTFTKKTRGGTIDISRQDIDWTVPSAWDILLSDLAAVYAEDVENTVADDFVAKATATPIAVGTNTLANWATAIYTAAAQVYAATTPARMPNRIWMAPDVWVKVGPLVDSALVTAGSMIAELVSSQGAAGFGGNMFAVPRVVVPSFTAGTCIVGVAEAYEVYEEVIGVLSAVEPSLLGVQVAYGGYIAYNAVEAVGLAPLTPPA